MDLAVAMGLRGLDDVSEYITDVTHVDEQGLRTCDAKHEVMQRVRNLFADALAAHSAHVARHGVVYKSCTQDVQDPVIEFSGVHVA